MAADDERRGFVEPDAAELFGRIDAEQAKLAGTLEQLARKRPVLGLEAIDARDDFLVRKLARRLRDQAMLVGQSLRREHC